MTKHCFSDRGNSIVTFLHWTRIVNRREPLQASLIAFAFIRNLPIVIFTLQVLTRILDVRMSTIRAGTQRAVAAAD